jgi:hypothetical protein
MNCKVIDNLVVNFYESNLRPEEQIGVAVPLKDIIRIMRLEHTKDMTVRSDWEKTYPANLFACDLTYFSPTVITFDNQKDVYPRQDVYQAFRLTNPYWNYHTAAEWRDRVFDWIGIDAHLAYVGPTGKEVFVVMKARINKRRSAASEISQYLYVNYLKTMKYLMDRAEDYPEWAEIMRAPVLYLPVSHDKHLRVQGIIR